MYTFALEAVRGGGPLLRRSLYRERVEVGRGDESSSSLCMEKVGSFHSSLLLTSIGFGVWEAGAQALSHSSSHSCSPWLLLLRSFSGWEHSHCHKHLCCRAWWGVQSAGNCMACSWYQKIKRSRVSFIKKWVSLPEQRGIRCKLHFEDNTRLQFKFAHTQAIFNGRLKEEDSVYFVFANKM